MQFRSDILKSRLKPRLSIFQQRALYQTEGSMYLLRNTKAHTMLCAHTLKSAALLSLAAYFTVSVGKKYRNFHRRCLQNCTKPSSFCDKCMQSTRIHSCQVESARDTNFNSTLLLWRIMRFLPKYSKHTSGICAVKTFLKQECQSCRRALGRCGTLQVRHAQDRFSTLLHAS